MTEIDLLKDIYFLLLLSSSILVLTALIRLGHMLLTVKKAVVNARYEKRRSVYDALFEQDNISQLMGLCEEELRQRPNSSLALFYMVKATAMREEYGRMQEYLARLHKVDPRTITSAAEYAQLLERRRSALLEPAANGSATVMTE